MQDIQDIHDIKPPLEISLLNTMIILSIISLIIIVIIYFLTNKNKEKTSKVDETQKIKIDYKKILINNLKKLERNIQKEDLRKLFHELSFYIKQYLKAISNKNIIEMTAKEIDYHFKNELLNYIMKTCYDGEFRKEKPELEKLKEGIKNTYNLINKL